MTNESDANKAAALNVESQQAMTGRVVSFLLSLCEQVAALHDSGRIHGAISVPITEQTPLGVALLPSPSNVCSLGRTPTAALLVPPELRDAIPLELSSNLEAASGTLRSLGIELDPRQIDVYQLGVLLCQLLTAESSDAYLCRLRTKMRVPEQLRPVIERALGCDGHQRFESASELLAALKTVSALSAVQSASIAKDDSESLRTKPDTTPSMVSKRSRQTDTSIGPVSGQIERNRPDSLPFQKLGHYEIVARIGQGGMGDVYRGYERSLDRPVAIKVLPSEFARQPEFVRRFRSEATAAAKIIHPNVTQIYFIGETDGCHFFAMQFVEGESLANLLKLRGRLSVGETLSIVEQVFAGLAAAHKLGLVHRDIKPGNVLLDRQHGRVLLADFGLVKSLQTSSTGMTVTGLIMGTADYMPPEQARGKQVDHRADLYSMGVLMYQMLSGRLPFQSDSPTALIFQHVYEQPPPLSNSELELPTVLVEIVEKLLRKSPHDRHQSAEDVLDELGATQLSKDRREPDFHDRRTAADQIIEVPPDKAKKERPRPSTAQFDTKSIGWWERARERAASLFYKHSPEALKLLQNTEQQIDGAIAVYERRGRKFQKLARDANSVLAELRAQAEAQRSAANRDPANRHAADEMNRQVLDQEEQLGSIQLDLAKVTAKVQQLKNQRDLLNARLKTARAGAKISRGKSKRPFIGRKAVRVAIGVTCLCVLAAVFHLSRTQDHSRLLLKPITPTNVRTPIAIAPFDSAKAHTHAEAWAKYLSVPLEYTNFIGMKFRLIPPGEFEMGSTEGEVSKSLSLVNISEPNSNHLLGCIKSEAPQHKVILKEPFYMGVHEVTQQQYENVMGSNPAFHAKSGQDRNRVEKIAQFNTNQFPVENVTWNDAYEFSHKLNEMQRLHSFKKDMMGGGTGYRLPTEAEWEFACRAGSTTNFWFANNDTELSETAWFAENSEDRTHAVGTRRPNPFGLFDMNGNVWEWCHDQWDPAAYQRFSQSPARDPVVTSGDTQHMVRGGSWVYDSQRCRSAHRVMVPETSKDWNIGFRVMLPVSGVRIIQNRNLLKARSSDHSEAESNDGTAGFIDSVPLVDLSRDVFQGKWEKNNSTLIGEANSKLYLPLKTPDDYRLKLRLQRLEGNDALKIGFMMAGRQGVLSFDFDGATRSGLFLDGLEPSGVQHQGRVFTNNVYETIVLTVHPGHLHVTVHGMPIIDWYGTPDRLTLKNDQAIPNRESPFLAISGARYQIDSAAMLPLEPDKQPSQIDRLQKSVSILPLIDMDRDTAFGRWVLSNDTLFSPQSPLGRIYLPVDIPEEYTISATVELPTRARGGPTLLFGLPTGKSMCELVFVSGESIGLEQIDGARWNANETSLRHGIRIEPGIPVRMAFTVTTSGVRFDLEGRTLIDWRGDPRRLTVHSDWVLPDGRKLFIGTMGEFKFRDVEIGPPLDPPSLPDHPQFAIGQPVDLLTIVDPTRDAISGKWTRDEKALRVLGDTDHALLTIPSLIPEEYKLTILLEREPGGKLENEALFLKLPIGSFMADVGIDTYGSSLSGIYLEGSDSRENEAATHMRVISAGLRQEITCFVRRTGIKVTTPTQTIIDWTGNPERLSTNDSHATPGGRISLGSYNSRFRFDRIEIEPLEPTSFPPVAKLGIEGNLMPIIHTQRDSRRKTWKQDAEGIVSSEFPRNLLRIPVAPPAQYVLTADVERLKGNNQLCIGLVVGGQPCNVAIDGSSIHAGLERLDGQLFGDKSNVTRRHYHGARLPIKKTIRVRCFVTPDTVIVTCGDQELIRWHGDPRRLSIDPYWLPPNYSETDRLRLWLGVDDSQFRIRDLNLRPLNDDQATKITKSFRGVFPIRSQASEPFLFNPLGEDMALSREMEKPIILSAKYGSDDDLIDVTEQVNSAAQSEPLLLAVDDSIAETSREKLTKINAISQRSLRLRYRLGGNVRSQIIPQHGIVDLGGVPSPTKVDTGFKLLEARLGTGFFGTSTWEDVTERLRSFVKQESLSLGAEQLSKIIGKANENVDQLQKCLYVRYEADGRERITLIPSGTPILLGNVPLQLGLVMTAYEGADFQRQQLSRIDWDINSDFSSGSPGPGIHPDNFSVRWMGMLKSPKSGKYRFYLKHDDGGRLWIDGQLLIDSWGNAGQEQAEIELTDMPHSITVELCDRQVVSALSLEWESESIPRQLVPAKAFFHDPRLAIQMDVK